MKIVVDGIDFLLGGLMILDDMDLFEDVLDGLLIRLKLMNLVLNRWDKLLLREELLVFNLKGLL